MVRADFSVVPADDLFPELVADEMADWFPDDSAADVRWVQARSQEHSAADSARLERSAVRMTDDRCEPAVLLDGSFQREAAGDCSSRVAVVGDDLPVAVDWVEDALPEPQL